MKSKKKAPLRPSQILESEAALRQRICQAAFGAFMERGYAGTSTLEIATRAKISKRELYALFKNKEAMLAAGIASRTERMQTAPTLPEPRDLATLAAILKQFGARVLREVSHPHVIAVYRLAIAERDRAPEVARMLSAAGPEATRKSLGDFLSRAQEAELLRRADAAEMATMFLALLWRDLWMRLLLGTAERPDDDLCTRRADVAAEQFLGLYRHGETKAAAVV
jgi:AcrR family transcriptional regulator